MSVTGEDTGTNGLPNPQAGGPVVGEESKEYVQLVRDEGVTFEMMGFSHDGDLDDWIRRAVDKAQRKVKADLGEAVFTSDDPEVLAAVKDAVVNFTLSKVWKRRKSKVLEGASRSGEEKIRAGLSEENAIAAALEEYEQDIERALRLAGIDRSFSFAGAVSSHFQEGN